MYRQFVRSSVPALLVTATSCVRSTPSSAVAAFHHEPCTRVSVLPQLQTQRRSLHSAGGVFRSSAVCRFDLRQYQMEKRKAREMEKAGIDPNDEDDRPWIAPEEQQRLDEEEEQRRAELEEQRKALLQKRAEEDSLKRQKFKEFRAKQISMSRNRKVEMAEKKEEARQHRREQNQRVVEEGAALATAAEGGEEAANAETISNEAAAGKLPMEDKK